LEVKDILYLIEIAGDLVQHEFLKLRYLFLVMEYPIPIQAPFKKARIRILNLTWESL